MRIYRKSLFIVVVGLHSNYLFSAAGGFLSRDITQDTPIQTSHPTEETIVLKKGSRIIIDLIAVREFHPFTYSTDRFVAQVNT
jgi:hypothetical protein